MATRASDVEKVRALGLVSSRRNLMTWSSKDGTLCSEDQVQKSPSVGKWIIDTDSSEAEEADEADSVESPSNCSQKSNEIEELDYLALDLVQVLPHDRVHRLLETLRQQDGLKQELLSQAKSLHKENKSLKQKNKQLVNTKSAWALPIPSLEAEAANECNGDKDNKSPLRKSRSARGNLISCRQEKDTTAAGPDANKLLERIEWALKVNEEKGSMTDRSERQRDANPQEKAASDATASRESTTSTLPCTNEEARMIMSLQKEVQSLTSANKNMKEDLEKALAELRVRTDALNSANQEILRLRAPKTYNLRLTPARYRGASSMTLPVASAGKSAPSTGSPAASPTAAGQPLAPIPSPQGSPRCSPRSSPRQSPASSPRGRELTRDLARYESSPCVKNRNIDLDRSTRNMPTSPIGFTVTGDGS